MSPFLQAWPLLIALDGSLSALHHRLAFSLASSSTATAPHRHGTSPTTISPGAGNKHETLTASSTLTSTYAGVKESSHDGISPTKLERAGAIGTPKWLQELKSGDALYAHRQHNEDDHAYSIERVSTEPPIFMLRDFLTEPNAAPSQTSSTIPQNKHKVKHTTIKVKQHIPTVVLYS